MSAALAASDTGNSAIALSPVPSAADWVMAPESSPTARPSSKPKIAVTATTVTRTLRPTTAPARSAARPPSSGSRRAAGRPNTRPRTGTGRRTPSEACRAVRVSPGSDEDAGNQGPDHGPETDTFEVKVADDGSEQDAQ